MVDFDDAYKSLEELSSQQADISDRNEAQTRLDLIDKVLTAFGWKFTVEDKSESGYTDYRLGTPATVAIVEAKREGLSFTLPDDVNYGIVSLKALLSGPENKDLKSAIKQCMAYCADLGVSQGIVTNGHQWVAFIATRSDSVRPLDGRALLIPSIKSFCDNFTNAWNLFSVNGLKTKSLERALDLTPTPAPVPLSVRLPNYPGTRVRNDLQSSLQILGQVFLEDIPSRPQLRERFLNECYATSGALSQFSELSRTVLKSQLNERITEGNVAEETVYGKRGLNEKLTGDIVSAAMSNKPIVLLGAVGVGKSTFIQRLINVDAKDLFSQAISIYVDYGNKATMSDLKQWTVTEVSRQIKDDHGIDIENIRFIEDLFKNEIKEFDDGINGLLKDVDHKEYLRRKVEKLVQLTSDKSGFIARAMSRIKTSHRKQIVIFLDNIDQRSKEDQNTVFLISNELAAQWPVTVFVTLRPETYYDSMRYGAVSGYHPRVFKIMPPRSDVVISKRLDFVLDLMSGNDEEITDILGYNLESDSLRSFLEMLSGNMVSNHDLKYFIDNMSGGNMRRALGFVTRFVGSGHVNTRKIVDIWDQSGSYFIPEHELLRALLHGDGNYYDPVSSDVINIFKCTSIAPRDHFLMPTLISFIERSSRENDSSGYVSAEEIYRALQAQGFSESSIQEALNRGVHHRLLEEPLTNQNNDNFDRLRITSVGLYSKNRLPHRFTYIDAIIVDTPILNSEYYERIVDAYTLEQRIARAVEFSHYLKWAWDESCLEPKYWSFDTAKAELDSDIEKVTRIAQATTPMHR
ncbi:hypothetical protein [Glutamicibacter protophormiae]|uniref:hypothetical protein n=1 Tax=Glutamicibacter protophormiae TaxID=37930 RepID=UPI003A8F736E